MLCRCCMSVDSLFVILVSYFTRYELHLQCTLFQPPPLTSGILSSKFNKCDPVSTVFGADNCQGVTDLHVYELGNLIKHGASWGYFWSNYWPHHITYDMANGMACLAAVCLNDFITEMISFNRVAPRHAINWPYGRRRVATNMQPTCAWCILQLLAFNGFAVQFSSSVNLHYYRRRTISEKLLVICFAATMQLFSNYFDLLFINCCLSCAVAPTVPSNHRCSFKCFNNYSK